MKQLHIDIETYSDLDLSSFGVYRYAEDPSFKLLLLAYAYDDDPVEVIDLAQGEELPKQLKLDLLDPNVMKHAFNAQFERVCLDQFLGENTQNWHCTMIHAANLGVIGSLQNVGVAFNLKEDEAKLYTGKNLIRLFCLPRKPTKANGMKTVYLPEDKPEEWELFKEYCSRDVEVERGLKRKMKAFPVLEKEQELYELDQAINDRGVRIDPDLAESAIAINDERTELLTEEYKRLTGLPKPSMVAKLKEYLSKRAGEPITEITKNNQETLKEQFKDDREAHRALEIRQALSLSSVSKYKAMLSLASPEDDRARGLFRFYGASTGRWAGRGIQPQNLPRNYIDDLDTAREIIRSRDLDLIETLYDNPSSILSQCIRTALIPSEGMVFAVADFSAIEARVIAWLAGEAWRQEVFSEGGDIYCSSASKMFGVPVEKHGVNSHLRQKGKIAELALGYQGSVGALVQMGAYDMGLVEGELKPLVDSWRTANPNIVSLWYDVENAAVKAIKGQGSTLINGKVLISYKSRMLQIKLPSGRTLCYPKARLAPHDAFIGKEQILFHEIRTQGGWQESSTYGGKLVENIVQAIARDCLGHTMLRLNDDHWPIVLHIHDEVVVEVDKKTGDQDLEAILEVMKEPLDWADGLLLNGDGFICNYYQKD